MLDFHAGFRLIRWRVKEAIQDVKKILANDNVDSVKQAAALMLADLGDIDGISYIMQKLPEPKKGALHLEGYLAIRVLNRFRDPATYEKLYEVIKPQLDIHDKDFVQYYGYDLIGMIKELERLSKKSIILDSKINHRHEATRMIYTLTIENEKSSLHSILDNIVYTQSGNRLAWVIEGDKIRIVTVDDAISFWKKWWDTEGKKQTN